MSRTFVWQGERSPCENTKQSPFSGFSCGDLSRFRPFFCHIFAYTKYITNRSMSITVILQLHATTNSVSHLNLVDTSKSITLQLPLKVILFDTITVGLCFFCIALNERFIHRCSFKKKQPKTAAAVMYCL